MILWGSRSALPSTSTSSGLPRKTKGAPRSLPSTRSGRRGKKGKVAKSAEFSSSLVLLAGIATLGLFGDSMLRSFAEMLRFFLSIAATPGAFNGSLLIAFLSWAAKIGLPILVVAFVVAIWET